MKTILDAVVADVGRPGLEQFQVTTYPLGAPVGYQVLGSLPLHRLVLSKDVNILRVSVFPAPGLPASLLGAWARARRPHAVPWLAATTPADSSQRMKATRGIKMRFPSRRCGTSFRLIAA